MDRKLGHDAEGDVVQHRPDLRGALLPASKRWQANPGEVINPALVAENDFWYVTEGWGRMDMVVIIKAVGEAELKVEARRAGGATRRASGLAGVVIPQVPILVIQIDLNIEGVANGTVVPKSSGVEDDFGVITCVEGDIADPVHIGGDLTRCWMIRKAPAHKTLNLRRQ